MKIYSFISSISYNKNVMEYILNREREEKKYDDARKK